MTHHQLCPSPDPITTQSLILLPERYRSHKFSPEDTIFQCRGYRIRITFRRDDIRSAVLDKIQICFYDPFTLLQESASFNFSAISVPPDHALSASMPDLPGCHCLPAHGNAILSVPYSAAYSLSVLLWKAVRRLPPPRHTAKIFLFIATLLLFSPGCLTVPVLTRSCSHPVKILFSVFRVFPFFPHYTAI